MLFRSAEALEARPGDLSGRTICWDRATGIFCEEAR